MPARLSSMELSSPSNPDVDASAQPSRRKSGRVHKKPEFLSPGSAGKRKRDARETGDADGGADMNDESEDENDDDADEEELREQRRKKKRVNKDRSRPTAKKKRMANGITLGGSSILVRRPANKAAKSKNASSDAAAEVGGLYGGVFGGDATLDGVAADWLQRYEQHEANAVAEVANFVLRCAGCEIEIDGHDVLDTDNATNRLSDIQDEFEAQPQVDYPLIAKGKGATPFRKAMTSFLNILIHSIAVKGLLTEQIELIENIENWVGTMSSANSRPFRHTATVASLEITLALAELGRAATDSRAKILRQAEGEKKGKRFNRSRVQDLERSAAEAGERAIHINEIIKRWFDAVFVHRYRDVDPRIRVDCVSYLSQWIWTYPEEFLDGAHLRYLGWVLSDTQAMTRLQVVRDIQKIFRDDSKIGGLRQFTERFRPRMVEMATRDGDLNVRCSCIELLDVLREKGLLEPDDVDVIGRLIFDVEPRARKAVAPFFAANVEDVYEARIDDFENVDEDALREFAQNDNEEDFESQKLEWVRFKCIAELLHSYDFTGEESERLIDLEASTINDTAEPIHSRISLATQALFSHLSTLRNWESLAGYLLKDIQTQVNMPNPDDISSHIDNACLLSSAEEAILLDVLNVSVKHALSTVTEETDHPSKRARKTKKELQLISEAQESAAQHLATLIPRLLKKFGSQPASASAVLRLGHLLNLEVFAQLREDSTTYASLLEDINRQFMQHEAASVLYSAKQALLHAKSFDELQEVTDGKLAALWDDTTTTLTRLCLGEPVNIRGSFHISVINALSSTVLRIANLASISDATEPLEKIRTVKSSNPRRKSSSTQHASIAPLQCLLDIVSRGVLTDSDPDTETATAEDTLVDHALRALTFHLMWRVSTLRDPATRIDTTTLSPLKDHHATLLTTLRSIITSRRSANPLRVKSAETLLELSALFSTLRARARHDDLFAETLDLPRSAHLPTQSRHAVLSVFAAVERDFAKKAHKSLVDPADVDEDAHEAQERERDEVEAEPESDSDSASDDLDDGRRTRKVREGLLAEQTLCQFAGKLVLALVGGCADDEGVLRRRLERNRARLGRNFADLVATLEPGKRGTRKEKTKKKKEKAVVEQEVGGDDDDDDDDEGEEEGLLAEGPVLEEDGVEDLMARELVEPSEVDADVGLEEREREREQEGASPESVLGD